MYIGDFITLNFNLQELIISYFNYFTATLQYVDPALVVRLAVPCSTLQFTSAVPAVPKSYSTCSTHSTLQYPRVLPQYPTINFSPCSTHSTHSTLQYPRVLPQYPTVTAARAVPTVPTVPCSTCGYCGYCTVPIVHSTHSTLQYPAAVPTVPCLPQYPRVLCSTRQGNQLYCHNPICNVNDYYI